MLIIACILVVSQIYLCFFRSKKSLHMLQQNLYNENNRYLKWVWKNKKQFLDLDLVILLLCGVGIFLIYPMEFLSVIVQLMIALIWLLLGLRKQREILETKDKKKLVVTARIKRLIVTISILYVIPLIGLLIQQEPFQTYWQWIGILSVLTYANPWIVFIAMIINTPIERCVYIYYRSKAQKKLKSMNHLKIIGITGSYGKTSSKNILSEILNIKYNALPTPKNLNTYNGLIMTVNNYMDKFTDIFIAEMGAYVKGEIAGLCRLVKPKYGILTTIGTAHLESFGSEQNIIDGKFELIESLPEDGFAILNGDDPKQVNYTLKNKVRTIWIGINNKEADVVASNIHSTNKGTSFEVQFKNEKEKYEFETKLLGVHNIYNILAGIACGREFDISIEDLQKAVKNVQPVEHRLELKPIGNFYMIDDAYNSNPVGAKNAVEVLSMMPGLKIVVTPGMIELGEKEEKYNRIFGEQIATVADYVVLIGSKQTTPIKEGLLEKGFDKDKIIVFNDVREAYPFIGRIAQDNQVYALFENDLPDTYNEK